MQQTLDSDRPGWLLLTELAASGCCAVAAIVRGLHAHFTQGRWHLLVGGGIWLCLTGLLAGCVVFWWDRVGIYGRLFLRGLARVLGVAALIALVIVAVIAAGEIVGDHGGSGGHAGGGHGGGDGHGGEGGSAFDVLDPRDLSRGRRRRMSTRAEYHAVLWPLGLGLLGGLLVVVPVGLLPIYGTVVGEVGGDVIGIASLVVGVALGGALGYGIARRRIARLHAHMRGIPPTP